MRASLSFVLLVMVGCGASSLAPATERPGPSVSSGDEARVSTEVAPAVSEEDLERVVGLIDSLGPAPEIDGKPIVATSNWAGPHYCFVLDADRRLSVTVFGAPCMVAERPDPLERNEVREHVAGSLGWYRAAEPSVRTQAIAAGGSMGVDVAAIARAVHREGSTALARALLAQALEAPHESQPTPDATPMRRLEGDIALAALRDAVARYEREPELGAGLLRARLEPVAQLEGLEAAVAAQRLLEVFRRMETALAAPQPSLEAQMVDDPHALYRANDRATPAAAMAALLPLLDSDFRIRRVDRTRYSRSDLLTLGSLALEMASQVVGRPLQDAGELRAWWAANEADQGVGEAWSVLEAGRDEVVPTRPLGVYVSRIVSVAPDGAMARFDALHRRGTEAFRQQLLGSLHDERWADDPNWRRMVRRSLESDELGEAAVAARLVQPDDERNLDLLGERLASLARREGEGYPHDAAVATMAQMLVMHGRAPVVLGQWTRIPHRIREQLARAIPSDVDPSDAAPALLDEGTLLVDAGSECASLLAADALAARLAMARGESFDCAAPPLARRAARAAMAGQPSPPGPAVQSRALPNGSVDYEGPTELFEAIEAALGGSELDAEGIRALLTALVRARPEPTMLAVGLHPSPTGPRLELRARAVRTPQQLSASVMTIAPDGSVAYGHDVVGPVPSSSSPLVHGAAPFRPLVEQLSPVLRAHGGHLLLQARW